MMIYNFSFVASVCVRNFNCFCPIDKYIYEYVLQVDCRNLCVSGCSDLGPSEEVPLHQWSTLCHHRYHA
jgi:hypothetical protein